MCFLLLFLHIVLQSGIPQCSISSDENPASLEPGTQLTLTVDIAGYYCSVETGFDLTTGAVTEELGTRHNVSVVTDLTITTTFSVDITRLGEVTLDFTCDRSWTVTCNGVQKLLKTPPHCNISSDTDTTALDPGTNLTLTVDIRNYYCSQTAGFQLTTGIITETLLENQTMDNITDTILTQPLSVTADHFGDVTVTFMCDSITRPLVCDGVDKFSVTSSPPDQPPPTTRPPPAEDDTVALAVGLSVGVAVILVIAIVLVVRSRRNKLTLK
ncbi:uncharacterized protein LOC124273250 [Haliotis rubra]|uniref:uncharacterized protein LOC124273250 n=1 Tax=Haliotis rubra TaxID=36100 RepID=UPI001EE5E977|nr:uncharacterized protein LOC124273250 [Haliotis rubra]